MVPATVIPGIRFTLMLGACHFPATLRTFFTGFDAFIHTADLLATLYASLANFGTNLAKTMRKFGVTELKISRCLAYLCAAHHQSKVICLDMLAAGFETVIHGGLQADLIATGTSLYTGWHGVFSMGWLIHGILLR